MADAPKDLSGEVVIHHPNCGADFQFRHYDEEQNVNYFQCVVCGLAVRIDAIVVSDVQDQGQQEDTNEQAAEPETAAAVEVIPSSEKPPGKQAKNRKKEQQPDHIR